MPKSILQQLFDGQIYPAENVCKDDPSYRKIANALGEEKERFLNNLSENDRECFEKIIDLYYEAAGIYSYECFAHGFRIGVALILEALNCKDTHMQTDE